MKKEWRSRLRQKQAGGTKLPELNTEGEEIKRICDWLYVENKCEGGIKDDCQVTRWMVVQKKTMFPHNVIAQIQSAYSIVLILWLEKKPTHSSKDVWLFLVLCILKNPLNPQVFNILVIAFSMSTQHQLKHVIKPKLSKIIFL